MKQQNHERVSDYYDSSQWLYRLFCYDSKSLGMHFGFWNKNTSNHQQAILNENQAIVNLGHIKAGQRILDTGCGVGGTAIYIAKTTGAHVTGITLVPQQVKLALNYATKHSVSHLTNFSVQDYTHTHFPSNSFDLIYGIESICYAHPKQSFLREALRLLKPGGRLVIADGYSTRKPQNVIEKKILSEFNQSFALKELITVSAITQAIKSTGFVNIKVINKTNSIKPSVAHFYRLARIVLPFTTFLKHLPVGPIQALHRNSLALVRTAQAIKINLATYAIHTAQKP